MIYLPTLMSIIEVLLVTIPVLLTVAYVTVAERKTMASMQRRLGPNIVGYLGLLQAFTNLWKFKIIVKLIRLLSYPKDDILTIIHYLVRER